MLEMDERFDALADVIEYLSFSYSYLQLQLTVIIFCVALYIGVPIGQCERHRRYPTRKATKASAVPRSSFRLGARNSMKRLVAFKRNVRTVGRRSANTKS